MESLKYDPIEDTDEYKKIKNELELKIEIMVKMQNIKKGLGYCHTYWDLKKKILKKDYNIDWKNPQELNPSIMFD